MKAGALVTYIIAPALYGAMMIEEVLANGRLRCRTDLDDLYEFEPHEVVELEEVAG